MTISEQAKLIGEMAISVRALQEILIEKGIITEDELDKKEKELNKELTDYVEKKNEL